MAPRFVISCLATLSLSIAASPALAQCPESRLLFPSLGPLTTVAPTFDVTSPDGGRIQGDHTIGQFSLHHSGSLAQTVIAASDRFDVSGVPPGTPVPMTFRLHITGWTYTDGCGGTGCCGYLGASIRAGSDSATIDLTGHTFGG